MWRSPLSSTTQPSPTRSCSKEANGLFACDAVKCAATANDNDGEDDEVDDDGDEEDDIGGFGGGGCG